jgi:hypothetical protein
VEHQRRHGWGGRQTIQGIAADLWFSLSGLAGEILLPKIKRLGFTYDQNLGPNNTFRSL